MDLAQGKIGEVGSYELDFASGQLVAKLDIAPAGGVVSAMVVAKLDGLAICDALAKAIPGVIDDALLGVLKEALKALSPQPQA